MNIKEAREYLKDYCNKEMKTDYTEAIDTVLKYTDKLESIIQNQIEETNYLNNEIVELKKIKCND